MQRDLIRSKRETEGNCESYSVSNALTVLSMFRLMRNSLRRDLVIYSVVNINLK